MAKYYIEYEHGDRYDRNRDFIEIEASTEREARDRVYNKSFYGGDEFCHIHSVEKVIEKSRSCSDINRFPELRGDPRG